MGACCSHCNLSQSAAACHPAALVSLYYAAAQLLILTPAPLSLTAAPAAAGSALEAQEALHSFFQALVSSGAPNASAESLLAQLTEAGTGAAGCCSVIHARKKGHTHFLAACTVASVYCSGRKGCPQRLPASIAEIFARLCPCLLSLAGAEASKSAQRAAAQCFAVLSAANGQGAVDATVQRLLATLQVRSGWWRWWWGCGWLAG